MTPSRADEDPLLHSLIFRSFAPPPSTVDTITTRKEFDNESSDGTFGSPCPAPPGRGIWQSRTTSPGSVVGTIAPIRCTLTRRRMCGRCFPGRRCHRVRSSGPFRIVRRPSEMFFADVARRQGVALSGGQRSWAVALLTHPAHIKALMTADRHCTVGDQDVTFGAHRRLPVGPTSIEGSGIAGSGRCCCHGFTVKPLRISRRHRHGHGHPHRRMADRRVMPVADIAQQITSIAIMSAVFDHWAVFRQRMPNGTA